MKANTAKNSQIETTIGNDLQGHGEKLSRKTEQAIVALLAHPTIPEAAKSCGMSETTLWRWLQREDFQKQYREAQNKVFDGALGSLQGAMTEAVDCLRRNLNCGLPSAEVQAAKAILDFTMKARELLDITERVKELERKLTLRGGFSGK